MSASVLAGITTVLHFPVADPPPWTVLGPLLLALLVVGVWTWVIQSWIIQSWVHRGGRQRQQDEIRRHQEQLRR